MSGRSATLQGDPRYRPITTGRSRSSRRATASRCVSFRPDGLYNFWQDAEHVRGIVRRTSLASYRTDNPAWETVLDVDALAAAEKARTGSIRACNCLPPRRAALPGHPLRRRPRRQCRPRVRSARAPLRRGRLQPARGQAERDLGGREHPAGRARLGAGDDDRVGLSVRRQAAAARPDARPGRGGLSRQRPTTSASAPLVLRDSDGPRPRRRRLSRPRHLPPARSILFRPGGNVILPIPQRASLAGIVDGRLLVTLDEPWEAAPGLRFADRFDRLLRSCRMEARPARGAAEPGLGARAAPDAERGRHHPRQADRHHPRQCPRPRLRAATMPSGAWRTTRDRAAAQRDDRHRRRVRRERAGDVQRHRLSDARLALASTTARPARLETIKTTPARFDASRHVVEQLEAVSQRRHAASPIS